MKVSYKQAWDMINHLNSHFETPKEISYMGGKDRGTAMVTPESQRIINKFHVLNENSKL